MSGKSPVTRSGPVIEVRSIDYVPPAERHGKAWHQGPFWVNLVDFYFVRHGHYAILEIFSPHGIYHRWAWRGITAYFVGLAAMIPFVSLTFFEGPVAKALGGADISFAVGLAVAGTLYYVFSRSLDLGSELEAAERSRRALVTGTVQ